MQFRDQTKEFEMRFVSFASGKATLSAKNPQGCLGCHGAIPHPIWANYPAWDGVYGSSDDNMSSSIYNHDEIPEFQKFIASLPHHPRFSKLIRRDDLSDAWPYRSFISANASFDHATRPNNRFGNLITGLQSQSIGDQILKSNFYKNYPNTVLLGQLQCAMERPSQNNFSSKYLPVEKKLLELTEKAFSKTTYPELYAKLDQLNANWYSRIIRINFMIEKLVLNSPNETWSFSRKGSIDDIDRFRAGTGDIDVFSATALLKKQGAFFKPHTFRQWYVQNLGSENLGRFLDLNHVAEDYNSVFTVFDGNYANKGCPTFLRKSLKELKP